MITQAWFSFFFFVQGPRKAATAVAPSGGVLRSMYICRCLSQQNNLLLFDQQLTKLVGRLPPARRQIIAFPPASWHACSLTYHRHPTPGLVWRLEGCGDDRFRLRHHQPKGAGPVAKAKGRDAPPPDAKVVSWMVCGQEG